MYRYSQHPLPKLGKKGVIWLRIMTVSAILLFIACVALGVSYARARESSLNARQELTQRIRACCDSAKEAADKLPSSAQSDTGSRLAQIRQYVYGLEQMNEVLVRTYGESSRLVPREAISALYDDLNSYFTILQSNTVSVLEVRNLLVNHLAALQAVLVE